MNEKDSKYKKNDLVRIINIPVYSGKIGRITNIANYLNGKDFVYSILINGKKMLHHGRKVI